MSNLEISQHKLYLKQCPSYPLHKRIATFLNAIFCLLSKYSRSQYLYGLIVQEESPDVLEDDTPESEISTPELDDETPGIRDKKPKSRPDDVEMPIETGVSREDTPGTPGKEQIVHVGSSR